MTKSRSKFSILEFLGVLIAFAAITWLYWSPLFTDPGAVYSVGRDFFQNNWNLWWTNFAWSHDHELLHTDWLFYPSGTTLAYHTITFANTMPGLILQSYFNFAEVHSYLFAGNFFLSALGAWALIRYLTGSIWGAVWGGILYSFCPYHTAMLTQLNNSQFQWIPLFLLSLVLLYDTRNWWFVAWGGLFMALAGYADWYQPIFASLAALIWFLCVLIRDKRLLDGKLWIQLASMGIISVVLVLPGILPLVKILAAGEVEEELAEAIRYVGEMDLLGINPQGSPLLHFWPVILSYSFCILFVYLIWRVRNRQMWPWLVAFAINFVFLLGPYLVVAKKHFPQIPLPMAILPHIPVLNMVRVPHRFLILIALCGAILGAFALQWFLERRSGLAANREEPASRLAWRSHLWGFAICMALVFEFKPVTLKAIELRPAEIYGDLAEDQRDFSIFELPLDFRDGYAMWLQTQHQKPIVGGYTSHIMPEALTDLRSDVMRACLPSEVDTDILNLPEHLPVEIQDLDEATLEEWRSQMLNTMRIGAIVFHHGIDFEIDTFSFPTEMSVWDKLAMAALPYSLNPFARDPQKWRQLSAKNFVETLSANSAQARELMVRLFGPPTATQGNADVWDLRKNMEERELFSLQESASE